MIPQLSPNLVLFILVCFQWAFRGMGIKSLDFSQSGCNRFVFSLVESHTPNKPCYTLPTSRSASPSSAHSSALRLAVARPAAFQGKSRPTQREWVQIILHKCVFKWHRYVKEKVSHVMGKPSNESSLALWKVEPECKCFIYFVSGRHILVQPLTSRWLIYISPH